MRRTLNALTTKIAGRVNSFLRIAPRLKSCRAFEMLGLTCIGLGTFAFLMLLVQESDVHGHVAKAKMRTVEVVAGYKKNANGDWVQTFIDKDNGDWDEKYSKFYHNEPHSMPWNGPTSIKQNEEERDPTETEKGRNGTEKVRTWDRIEIEYE